MNRLAVVTFLLLAACESNPFEIDVVNETGGELWLEWDTATEAEGVALKDYAVISAEGGTLDWTGAPPLNKTWDISITAVGVFGTGTRTVEKASRDEVSEMVWDADDVTNFHLVVTNDSGLTVTEFHVRDRVQGDIGSDERPGDNYGPIDPGGTVEISLPAMSQGLNWVAVTSDFVYLRFETGDETQAGQRIESTIDE